MKPKLLLNRFPEVGEYILRTYNYDVDLIAEILCCKRYKTYCTMKVRVIRGNKGYKENTIIDDFWVYLNNYKRVDILDKSIKDAILSRDEVMVELL